MKIICWVLNLNFKAAQLLGFKIDDDDTNDVQHDDNNEPEIN